MSNVSIDNATVAFFIHKYSGSQGYSTFDKVVVSGNNQDSSGEEDSDDDEETQKGQDMAHDLVSFFFVIVAVSNEKHTLTEISRFFLK